MIVLDVVLLAGLLIAVMILLKRMLAQRGLPQGQALFITLAVIFIVVVALLAVSGRLNWLAAAVAALLPFLRRLGGLLRFLPHFRWGGHRTASQSSSQSNQGYSEVQSEFFRMSLNHANGAIDGEILKGSQCGRFLGELDLTELLNLREEISDADSRRLLDSYLEKNFPGATENSRKSESGSQPQTALSRSQALAVLGLQPGATREEIISAHRKLMQRVHPDRGGSSFLAAQLNEAKAALLDAQH